MDRKKRNELETPCYSYGAIEAALGTVFGADSKIQQGALRGRLKHLQRLGLPGVEAGKGARITYSATQANQWLVALLMSDAGIAPNVAVEMIQKYWVSFLAMWVRKATDTEAFNGKDGRPPNPIFLTLQPRLMSGNWAKRKPSLDTLPWVGGFRRFDYHLKTPDGRPRQRELISGALDELEDGWFCVRNLTDALHKFHTALEGK